MKLHPANPAVMLFVALILLAACSKKSDTPSAQTNTELLTSKPWKLIGRGYDVSGNNLLDDNENFVTACEADDTYHYKTNGEFFILDNSLKCDPSDPDSTTAIWEFRNDETEFLYNVSVMTIRKLDKDSLILFEESVAYFYRFVH